MVVFFSELSRVLLQGQELLRLGAPNGWNTTGRLQVVDCSVGELVNPILSGPPDDPPPYTYPDGSKYHPRISSSTDYYRSPENKKKSNHHIQFNKHNNLQKKMVEQTYHEMLSTVINELLCLLLAVLTPHVRFHKQLHRARLTSNRRSL